MLKILISLHIILPVLGALLSVLFRNHRLCAKAIVTSTLFALFIASASIFLITLATNEYSYSFGDWPVPFGIELKINYYSAIFLVLISLAALCSFLYGQSALQIEMAAQYIPIFFALFLICIFGMYGLVMTNDFFNLYVFIEINAITTYTLVSWNSTNKKSMIAAFYYLIIGSVAATFILIGIGYLYSASGTLNIGNFISRFESLKNLKIVSIGISFIAVGLAIKSALFPFDTWLLKVYKETNSFMLHFLGATSNKIYLFVFAKLFYIGLFDSSVIKTFLLPAGIMNIVLYSASAIVAKNLRKILTLSGLMQGGYVLVLLAFEYKFSLLLIALLLASYGIASMVLFMLTTKFASIRRSYYLKDLGKMTKEAPLYVTLFVINSFSLIGFPMTIGFFPKFGLFIDLIHNKAWFAFAFVSCTSFLATVYLLRIINQFVFLPSTNYQHVYKFERWRETLILIALTSLNLAVGFVSLYHLRIFSS